MGEPVPISLGLRSNPARNPQAGNARLINCYAEETTEDGKTVWTLYGTPGYRNFGSALNVGPIRALLDVDGTLYVVSGRDVFAVTSAGAATRIGGIATDGPVYWERNRKIPPQIGLVSSGAYYVIDTLGNSVTEILDPDLPAPISFSVLDGYGILPIANRQFMLTGIDEFTTIDGLDQGTVEAYPDEIVRSMVLERELVMFKQTSTEWFQNTGAADFPFERVHAIETGCLSAESCAKVDTQEKKTLIWVAPDHTVRAMSGYSGQVISNNEIHKLIERLHEDGNIGQLKGIAWAQGGKFAYALSCDSWTRIYDAKTGYWREHDSYGVGRWRVGAITKFGTKLIAGDFETGQLYEVRSDLYDEAGQPLIATIQTPHVHAFPYRIAMNGLYIDAARGVGLNSPLSHIADPELMISWSKDSGDSWSAQRLRKLGALGRKAKRIQPITRLGMAGQHGVIFRFSISAPVERVVIAAALDFDRLSA
jgi:hypothetical protein